MPVWKKIDVDQSPPVFLEPSDICYYAREYIAKGGFSASQTNQLINNFKKSVDRKGKPEWKYKTQAVRQFAEELSSALNDGAIVAPVPSSKCKSDPQYDSRLVDCLRALVRQRPNITAVEALVGKTTLQAVHLGGVRSPSIIYQNLDWAGGLPNGARHLILVDDVLTTGAHFKACQRLVLEKHPDLKVIGAFWAKTVWPADTVIAQ
jgi:hypothetical protein